MTAPSLDATGLREIEVLPISAGIELIWNEGRVRPSSGQMVFLGLSREMASGRRSGVEQRLRLQRSARRQDDAQIADAALGFLDTRCSKPLRGRQAGA